MVQVRTITNVYHFLEMYKKKSMYDSFLHLIKSEIYSRTYTEIMSSSLFMFCQASK